MPDQKPAWEEEAELADWATKQSFSYAAICHYRRAYLRAIAEIARLKAADSGNLNPEKLEDKE